MAYVRICGGGTPHHSSLQPDRLHFPGLRRFQHAAHHGGLVKKMTGLGIPIAMQDLLVGISFLIILAIVNSMERDGLGRCGSGRKSL